MTREDFDKRGKCKHGHCSPMTNSAWCDVNSDGTILKLHNKCPKSNCNCQKQTTVSSNEFELEGSGFIDKKITAWKGTEKA